MISIDDHPPPDPSSSSHHNHHLHHHQEHQQKQKQQIAHDLKVSDIDLKSQDADLHDANNQLPNFSIRDYVLGLRNKDVSCNWPFSSTSLQLCLKHGVKNLLPPFQSLHSLRNNNSSDQTRLPDNEQQPVTETISNDQNQIRLRHEQQQQSSRSVTVTTNPNPKSKSKEKEKPSSSSPDNIKKSKSVMKLNHGVEQTLDQETPMASKICPVCKIFSSSSNTTLNAHIDQCLTGDQGTMKWSTEHDHDHNNPKVVTVKHRVKPRKTRLMVEIYKTAPRCTIEELDRRNGTNWATNSSFFPNQEFQFDQEDDEEEKLQEIKKPTIDRDVGDNEGDVVYIDTDGTKVRILSVPKSGNSLDNNNNNNNHGNGKLLKGVKGKNKKLKSNLHDLKQKQHHKKCLKISSPKLQVRNGEEDEVAVIVRPPWACSKRTNLAKRKLSKNLSLPLMRDDVAVSLSRKKTRASSPLMADFRKESSSMHEDDNEDDDDEGSPDSRNLDSFDPRSKGSKFLRKSASFDNETFDQESSKENSGNEEHEHEDHEESSSVGVEAADNNIVESVRNETEIIPQPNRDQVCVFTGLSDSFDPEFSKCVEMYQEQLLICSTNRAPDVEKHDVFFHEDDPIPIPGPPGSFLPPSPGGDMVVSDQEQQLQANSSSTTTTTTRVEIENHHHDTTMDRDSMSNSPVSTVSNPSNLARSDSRSTKSFTSFKNDNHQPCCCSRKDTAFSYNQELPSVRRQQQMTESNKSLTGFNFNYSTSGQAPPPETASFPAVKDYDSAASPAKPVLRLMGKNLTVVKTDEDHVSASVPVPVPVSPLPFSQPFRPPQLPQPPPPPVAYSQFQNGSESQRFNVYPPFQNHGGFITPMDRYGHGGTGPYMGHTHTHTVPHARSHHGHNSNEIIIIDDDLAENDSMRNEIMRRNRAQMNPLYAMYHHAQSSGHVYGGGGGGGSTVFRGGGFNGDLGKWDVGSSSSTSHMRSSTSYYPPSYP